MNLEKIRKELNKPQIEAVMCTEGPLIVFAGAGSGKTRVLTYRISYMISEKDVNPENILAITFTNKAANEMKERIKALVGDESDYIWAMTFHSMCARILRMYADRISYENNFTIYDTDDSKKVIKDIIHTLKMDDKKMNEKNVQCMISSLKNNGIGPDDFVASSEYEKNVKKVYRQYEDQMFINNAFDFDDLLLKTEELLANNKDVLEILQNRFRYILVDEYQDTNHIQFKLIELLAKKYQNICVVGDDDQSIYGFRGADVSNILEFQKQYPKARIVKLEQNYRSTQEILENANAVISHNKIRAKKKLWSTIEHGEKVIHRRFNSAIDEANSVIRDIYSGVYDYDDIAILYRSNAQSRLLEEAAIRYKVPYQIIGGVNFYQRKEIKDILSYLRMVTNPSDSVSVERAINVPKRSIGKVTIEKVKEYAKVHDISLYQAMKENKEVDGLNSKTKARISSFISQIDGYKEKLETAGCIDGNGDGSYSIEMYIQDILNEVGYMEELERTCEEDDLQNRVENINELVNKIVEFENDAPEPTLSKFLEDVSLITDASDSDGKQKIKMMTIHASKGLEVKEVYMVGMNEMLFPSSRALSDGKDGLEEERRLCYVGMTRAKEKLVLTSTREQKYNGKNTRFFESRFLSEMNNIKNER